MPVDCWCRPPFSVRIRPKELEGQMSKYLLFCTGIEIRADFHSQMSVCRHELGMKFEPGGLNPGTSPGNSNTATFPQLKNHCCCSLTFKCHDTEIRNQLPSSFRQPHSVHCNPGSPHPAHNITSSQSPPSLASPITASTFHSRLKTHLFHKSFPP